MPNNLQIIIRLSRDIKIADSDGLLESVTHNQEMGLLRWWHFDLHITFIIFIVAIYEMYNHFIPRMHPSYYHWDDSDF